MQPWTPHDYQLRAIKLLLSQGSGGLLLDPGLGKTAIALAAYRVLKTQGYAPKGMLVIAPLRPCYNVWPDEMEKWLEFNDLTYAVMHGNEKNDMLKLDVDIHIINPEGLQWLFNPLAHHRKEWSILCVDESTKFKNSTTKRFKLMRKWFPQFARRWILTGTPMPLGLQDLFGQIFILDDGAALGRYITHFRAKYFYSEPWNPYQYFPQDGAFEQVVEKIDPFVLRLAAKDYLDMPPVIQEAIYIDLPPDARERYKDIEDDFITQLEEGTIVAANSAVAGGKCRQICNGALYLNKEHDWTSIHNAKLDAMGDLIEQLGGAPLLIMYEFNHDKERLLGRFGSTIPVLGGGTSAGKSDQYIQEFNDGQHPIMICHPASMAHGLNLQDACHHICWFGITWNLEHYDQANARVNRQGQRFPVFIYHILARDTLDDTVAEVLRAKDHNQKKLFASLSTK
jgi:SNF2 family DNA or RNA helicase